MKKKRFRVTCLVLACFVAAAPLAAQAAPEEAEAVCQENLKALAFALIRYLGENDGKPPARISDLFTAGLVIELSVFSCPASGRKIDDPTRIDALTDYRLVGELTDQRPHLLAQDRFGTHGGLGLAYYSDQKFKKVPMPPLAAEPDGAGGVAAPAAAGAGWGWLWIVGILGSLALAAAILRAGRRRRGGAAAATVIEVTYADGSGKRFPLAGQSVAIGRGEENQLRINDSEVSSRHAVLTAVPGGWKLQDAGSRNGTRVNGQRVNEALVTAGDSITIGTTTLKLG